MDNNDAPRERKRQKDRRDCRFKRSEGVQKRGSVIGEGTPQAAEVNRPSASIALPTFASPWMESAAARMRVEIPKQVM